MFITQSRVHMKIFRVSGSKLTKVFQLAGQKVGPVNILGGWQTLIVPQESVLHSWNWELGTTCNNFRSNLLGSTPKGIILSHRKSLRFLYSEGSHKWCYLIYGYLLSIEVIMPFPWDSTTKGTPLVVLRRAGRGFRCRWMFWALWTLDTPECCTQIALRTLGFCRTVCMFGPLRHGWGLMLFRSSNIASLQRRIFSSEYPIA